MKLDFFIYWAMMAISLFNTIVLFWLGFTVWLNAEKQESRFRQGGIWLATAGLLMGGVFFATHTAMLDFQVEALVAGVRSWWYFFFAPIILLPHAWYLLMLWYAGFWDDRTSALHHRHRAGLIATTLLVIALIALLFFANPFAVVQRSTLGIVNAGVRLFPYAAFLYPLYILGCTALSLDALHRPAKSGRMMGDMARRRARPWLLAATLAQLAVSLLVGGAFAWLVFALSYWDVGRILEDGASWIDRLDLLLTILLAVTIILAGKAMVSYEIFTGKTLPRRGFLRQWRGVVSVAAVSSTLIAWCIGTELRPIYALLVVVILATATFALLSWRFFRERDELMAQLRPFAASQHLVDRVLAPQQDSTATHNEAAETFRALCEEVLETRGARLIPMGALAPLISAPLCFPDMAHAPETSEDFGAGKFSSHQTAIAVKSNLGAAWAIPLWSSRGLSGVLLLAEKCSGALYAEEEISLAQAGGERLLDALAGAALASRLMELQRRRLSEAQLADGQGTLRLRRALHDDILPRLHAAMLTMNDDQTSNREAQRQLAGAHREISDLLRAMPSALPSRLTQHGIFGALRAAVAEEFAEDFQRVAWHIAAPAQERASTLSPLVAETLFHAAREAIRNAARHARGGGETKPDLIIGAISDDELQITIEDDGVGVQAEYSAAENVAQTNGGHGLALHSTMMAVAGGALTVEANTPRGTRIVLSLPVGEKDAS
jgi:signal transduction histidine kinase